MKTVLIEGMAAVGEEEVEAAPVTEPGAEGEEEAEGEPVRGGEGVELREGERVKRAVTVAVLLMKEV